MSRFTVRQALETLVNEGLIRRRAGSGTYLTGLHRQGRYVRVLRSVEDLLAIGDETRFVPEHPLRLASSGAAAERLRLEREEVWMTKGARHLAGSPLGYWEVYLPPEELLGVRFASCVLHEAGSEAFFESPEVSSGPIRQPLAPFGAFLAYTKPIMR